jgi:hypothetical protein
MAKAQISVIGILLSSNFDDLPIPFWEDKPCRLIRLLSFIAHPA